MAVQDRTGWIFRVTGAIPLTIIRESNRGDAGRSREAIWQNELLLSFLSKLIPTSREWRGKAAAKQTQPISSYLSQAVWVDRPARAVVRS
jgi:hypothetical protein